MNKVPDRSAVSDMSRHFLLLKESTSWWTEWEFTRALSLAVKRDALRINS
jgi:hypothetical protein